MVVSINYNYKTQRYEWSLYDGPDGIDHARGFSDSLGEAFEQIVKARTLIHQQY